MLNNRASAFAACLVLITCGGSAPKAEGQSQGKAYFPPIPPADQFDTASEHSDMRRLMIGDCPARCRPGPMARIQPVAAAAKWTAADRESGKVIARIISDSAYPKFNIHGRDTVYWAVVKRGDAVVSIFHSTTPRSTDLETRTQLIPHEPGFFGGIALARWIWSDTDDMAWGTCDGGACCRSGGR